MSRGGEPASRREVLLAHLLDRSDQGWGGVGPVWGVVVA